MEATLEKLFVQAIQEMAIYKKLEGYSEDKIYNWRTGRKKYTRAEILDVLSQLGIISITIN